MTEYSMEGNKKAKMAVWFGLMVIGVDLISAFALGYNNADWLWSTMVLTILMIWLMIL